MNSICNSAFSTLLQCIWNTGGLAFSSLLTVTTMTLLRTICPLHKLRQTNLMDCNWAHVVAKKVRQISQFIRCFRKSAESDYLLHHVRISVRPSFGPHWRTQLPLYEFSWNSIFEHFYLMYVLLKCDKNNEHFTWKPIHICDNITLNSSQKDKFFRQKL
jgi:hypothetical protein